MENKRFDQITDVHTGTAHVLSYIVNEVTQADYEAKKAAGALAIYLPHPAFWTTYCNRNIDQASLKANRPAKRVCKTCAKRSARGLSIRPL